MKLFSTSGEMLRAEDYEPLPDPVVLFDCAAMAAGVLLLMAVLLFS